MTLKDSIENNLTLYTLGLLFAGFVSGITTYKFMLDNGNLRTQDKLGYDVCDWQDLAKKASWVPQEQCPASPLELKLASPGNGSVVEIDKTYSNWFMPAIVVSGSRPLPTKSRIGVIFKSSESKNYYVLFPGFESTNSVNIFRRELVTDLPFKLKPKSILELRALIVDDAKKIGSQFGSIQQIKDTDPSVFVSEPVTLNVK